MARSYRLTLIRRAVNALMKTALRLGIAPRQTRLLSVAGRRSGKVYETPVNLVELDGVRYLVSPYGERAWVRNVRAADQVELRRGGLRESRRIEELAAAEAAPVLREYLRQNPITRPFFDVDQHASYDALVAEAPRHPVFRLV